MVEINNAQSIVLFRTLTGLLALLAFLRRFLQDSPAFDLRGICRGVKSGRPTASQENGKKACKGLRCPRMDWP